MYCYRFIDSDRAKAPFSNRFSPQIFGKFFVLNLFFNDTLQTERSQEMLKKSLLLCSAAAAAILLSACQMFPAEEELPAAPVIRSYETVEYKQSAVIRGDLEQIVKVSCKYVPAKKEDLGFVLGGERINRIYVDNGDQVKAGEILADLVLNNLDDQIVSKEYDIRVLEAKKEHLGEDLELTLKKLKLQDASAIRIEETNETYEKQLQQIEDSLYINNLQLEALRKSLAERQIIASFDGSVTFSRDISDGERSVEGRSYITVADMNSTAFTVEGEEALYFPVGTPVTLICNKTEMTAVSVEPSALGIMETQEREKPIAYLKLDQPDPSLEDGDKGDISITVDSRTDVLYVTKDAVKTAEGKQFVYVLDENGLKAMQPVTVGLDNGKYVEIISGLSEGDSVILD